MITAEQVRQLRSKTGLSVMQCRKALEEADGDMERAAFLLRQKGGEALKNKSGRALSAGVVSSYIHNTGTVGAIVELFCETDFVAKNEEFRALAHDVAMQVAATDPQFLNLEDITPEVKKSVEEIFLPEVGDIPRDLKKKILEEKLRAHLGERTLMEQPFIKNPELTVSSLVAGAVQKFGERIEIRRFARFSTQG
ncbi:elongation factor Ts [Patescibacteria group bacterium]|nr:MAG: elongation factor Ts [Patescibacteria group bacterium]